MAASVVMGRNANGRTEWKNMSGKSIKDVEEENLILKKAIAIFTPHSDND
jgi:hypothetical protein